MTTTPVRAFPINDDGKIQFLAEMTPDNDLVVAPSAGRRGKLDWTGILLEVAGVVVLLGVTAFFLVTSWRKWNHPIIDFGRELYIPWRLSEGAVLYRDVDDVYGPLSQYFNAALFRLFGPGLMVLVTANLVFFAALLGMSYVLFRRAWGAIGALGACLVLVSIFSFSQFLVCANFNYATPYAHEATHGRVVSLLLVWVLADWVGAPTRGRSVAAGLLLGLNFLLKPEYILAGLIVTAVAIALRWRATRGWPASSLLVLGASATLPTVSFICYFLAKGFTVLGAADAANRAWTSLIAHSGIAAKNYQLTFLGFDHPWSNFVAHLYKTALVVGCLGAFGAMVGFALKQPNAVVRWVFVVLICVAAFAVGQWSEWGDVGRCLLGLNLLYLCCLGRRWLKRAEPAFPRGGEAMIGRVLLAVLATALMSRMVLSGRIIQFGFFQAALASMVVVAVICAESAEWVPSVRGRRLAVAAVSGALLMPGIVWCTAISQRYLKAQTVSVGEGRDRFYYLPPEIDGTAYLMNRVLEVLRTLPRDATLVVLPEGEMLNYLARRRSPLPHFQFYSFVTEDGRERAIVKELDTHPPDYVVIFSRDLHDYDIARYGEREGAGREIIEWLEHHYRMLHHFGDDPLSSDQRGAYVLERVGLRGPKSD